MGRKRKLKKGIRSLKKQNGIHGKKIEEEKSKPHSNKELIAYWEKEREKRGKTLRKRKGRSIGKKEGNHSSSSFSSSLSVNSS